MQRRTFLWLSLTGAASLTLPSLSCSNKNAGVQKTLAQPKVLFRFCDVKTIKEIGEKYRQLTPAENGADRLQEALLRTAGGNGKTTPSDAALQTQMEQNIKKDFEANRIVRINGWILSVTEARQCALYSIL